MKYLVTGGAGFIGSNLCRRLLHNGHFVVCLDDLSTGKYSNIEELEKNSNFEFINHDLTKSFFPGNIDAIFNLACPASPVHYQYNPIRTLKMGTLAMYNVLGMATYPSYKLQPQKYMEILNYTLKLKNTGGM